MVKVEKKTNVGKRKYQEGRHRRELNRRKKKGTLEKIGYATDKSGKITKRQKRGSY